MRWGLVVCGLVLVGLIPACGARQTHKTSTPTITAPQPPKQNNALPWPTYGADNRRTRSVIATGVRPPFRRLWTFHGHHLLELPPVAGYGLLYEESFDGRIHALDAATGAERWTYDSHRCGWASPALAGGVVFATFIGDVPAACSRLGGGAIVALSARTGRVLWSRNTAKTESSPLVADGIVYFGDADGRVHALSAATGKERWSYDTNGAVKGSPALERGRLFIGNYGGSFYGLDAGTGKLIWQSNGHGNFYAGPSVVGGRVYVSSINGNVYAFSARDGAQLWNFSTGGYVYPSTAVWRGIVLVGSYDGRFYAINAAAGTMRWDFNAGGKISGAASVIDGLVYFSTLSPHKTFALNAANGRLVKEWNDGDYSPAVAGYGHLFLVGLGRIYALEPR